MMVASSPIYVYRGAPPGALHLDALGVTLPHFADVHPNRAPFRGVLTRLDEPSTRAPSGSGGHRTLIPSAVAEKALPSLIGMGVNVAFGLRDHDKQAKIGVITGAEVVGQDLVVEGYLFAKDFPHEVAAVRQHRASLGMSYELTNVDVVDPAAEVWVLRDFVFTGAAILLKQAAAYHETSIVAASLQGESPMSKLLEELKKISAQLAVLEAAGDEDAAKDCQEEEATADERAAKDCQEEEATDAEADALLASMQQALAKIDAAKQAKAKTMAPAKQGGVNDANRLMSVFMRAMTYPGGAFSAEHDDEEEDLKLFRRLMKEGRGMQAAAQAQEIKDLKASMGLITDQLKTVTGLLTDLAQSRSGLATDPTTTAPAANGGPVRKTLSGAGQETWLSKFQEQEAGAATADADLDAQLDREGVKNPQERLARKLQAQWDTTARVIQ